MLGIFTGNRYCRRPAIDIVAEHLKRENQNLKEQVEWFKRQLFGQKSEKFIETKNDE